MIDTMNITDPMELALVVWIGDRRVECAEIDAETGEVLQLYRGRNRPSEWHDRIAVAVRQYGVERRMVR